MITVHAGALLILHVCAMVVDVVVEACTMIIAHMYVDRCACMSHDPSTSTYYAHRELAYREH